MKRAALKLKPALYHLAAVAFLMSLMTAFMAEYDSGEIVIDPKELCWRLTGIATMIYRSCRRPACRTASDRRYRGNVSGLSMNDMIH